MIKYARVINEETGLCEVGLGTNNRFYISIGMKQMDVQKSDIDGNWYLADKCPMKTDEQKKQEEQNRILELSVSKSDFFDATIKAFGLDKDDFRPIIINMLSSMNVDDITLKIALNNYENAKDFHRKHTLFTLLSDVPIKVTEDFTITITTEQWNKYFDKANNIETKYEAYKELLPIVEENINIDSEQ